MSPDFCPCVIEFVPRPYPWLAANPAISVSATWNVCLSAPQTGHCQSRGNSCKRTHAVVASQLEPVHVWHHLFRVTKSGTQYFFSWSYCTKGNN